MIVVWKVIAALQRRKVRTQEAGRYKKNIHFLKDAEEKTS